jgi:hypothetical protein
MGGEKINWDEHAQVLENDLAIPYFIGLSMMELNM